MHFRSSIDGAYLRILSWSPWRTSLGVHALILFFIGLLILARTSSGPTTIELNVIEAPTTSAPISIQQAPPAPTPPQKPKKSSRAISGQSRRALASEDGISHKLGNTLAKTPDSNILKDSDPDDLPIPMDEYLISAMPVLESEVRVPYPPAAKAQGIQGVVVFDLLIDQAGQVREVKFVSGPSSELNDAAAEAVRKFRFKPAQVQGQAVAVRIRYGYRFVLE